MKGIVAVAVVAIYAVQVVSGLSNLQILLNGINRQKADVKSTLDRLERHKRDFSYNLQHKLSNMKLNSMQEINSIVDQALKNVKNATDKSAAEGKDASQCYEVARIKLREHSQTGFSDLEGCRKEVLSSVSPTEANIDSTILTGQQVISYFDSIVPSCFSINTQQMEFCIIGKIPQGTQMAKAFESTTNTVMNSSNLAANQALINGMNCNWGVTSRARDRALSVRIDATKCIKAL